MWAEELERLYRMLLVRPGSRILDVGTGVAVNVGLLLSTAPTGSRIWSVDPEPASLEAASERFREEVEGNRLVLEMGSAENLPFRDEFFDYVTSAMTLHHVRDKGRAFREFVRVMKGDGLCLIMDWGPGGSAFSPHSSDELEESMEETLRMVEKFFLVRARRIREAYYYLVVEKP